MAQLQAFYSYRQLASMWHRSPHTVGLWLSILRRDQPARVVVTYNHHNRARRECLIAAETAKVLQDRFVLTPQYAAQLATRHRAPLAPSTVGGRAPKATRTPKAT